MPADLKDDDFSIIERLADAIRIEDEVHQNTEDRERLVKDLYEGPRKCQCCVNWVNDKPVPIEIAPVVPDPEEFTHPLIVRHRLLPTAIKGAKRLEIHSIEVRHPQVRKVLYEVFQNLDNIVPMVRYLVLRAPFRQFFWRWAKFEQAIEEQESEVIKEILIQLRALVRTHLAEAFAVSEELTSHGIINFKYIWTLFPPGELVYERDNDSLSGQFHIVTSVATPEQERLNRYGISCLYTDWNGYTFGSRHIKLDVNGFIGTRQIHHLEVVPAKYLPDFEKKRQKCLERGRKFHQFAELTYKAYLPANFDAEGDDETGRDVHKNLSTRIMLDATGHPTRNSSPMMPLVDLERLRCMTMLISQAPVDQEPPGGHRPLEEDRDEHSSPNDMRNRGGRGPPRPGQHWGPQRPPGHPDVFSMPPPPIRRRTAQRVIDSDTESDSDTEDEKEELTELQLLLCNSRMQGYSLRDKAWRSFDVGRICDIERNEEPFDSLVLPEGYKDLILSFVENQLRDDETFDDVINGKGGGLVILLAGSPGVGKTLTAESVAEKINAPLVKVELASLLKEPTQTRARNAGAGSDSEDEPDDELSDIFSQAAKWKAVLLIDECDMYLEKRLNSETHSQRNRLVARFLRELEYYPSLLFLTTNREKVLDPAIYSRIHLTINYPPLDAASRLAIWRTFLGREGSGCVITEDELRILSEVETNGRRIKNITKTARVMAKRKGRGVTFMDLRDVMRITEGLVLPVPAPVSVRFSSGGFDH